MLCSICRKPVTPEESEYGYRQVKGYVRVEKRKQGGSHNFFQLEDIGIAHYTCVDNLKLGIPVNQKSMF